MFSALTVYVCVPAGAVVSVHDVTRPTGIVACAAVQKSRTTV
jgi:hypothetical protein